MAADQAPESSRTVRHALFRCEALNPRIVDQLGITTEVVSEGDGGGRALTRIDAQFADQRGHELGKALGDVLGKLPGFRGSYAIAMGRTYEFEWDGITRPC